MLQTLIYCFLKNLENIIISCVSATAVTAYVFQLEKSVSAQVVIAYVLQLKKRVSDTAITAVVSA